ncbi:MAG: N-acetyl-gamma-glutamyl-phosphate reductase [Thermoplasmatota archaeon]
MTTIAVFGSRGYLGRELMRLLLEHPAVDTILPVSSESGAYRDHVPGFAGCDLDFWSQQEALDAQADVAFFATGAGVARELAPQCQGTVIDLSRDHRQEALQGGAWSYGLADMAPPTGNRIANPGCYPTASLLASLPALEAGLAQGPMIVDGKSSISGAGATPRDDLHYPAAHDAVRAYKVLGHDHQSEIAGKAGAKTRFTPHLVPMGRGLLSTVYLHTDHEATEVQEAYRQAYADAPFVHFGPEPDTSHVIHTNHAQVAVDVDDGILVARCAIDNLRKGGSGQAIQNMNHVLGLDPTTGLTHAGGGP